MTFKIKRAIIKVHKNVYHITQYKKTPLHYAASKGHSVVVQMLLDNGANIEAVDQVTNYLMS